METSVAGWLPASSTLVSINFLDPSFELSPGNLFVQVIGFPTVNGARNLLGAAPAYKFVNAGSVPDASQALQELADAANRGVLRVPSVEVFDFQDVHQAAAKLMTGHVR